MSAERGNRIEPVKGVVDAALEIVAQRRDTKRRLRDALERGDKEEALRLASVIVGLDNDITDEQGVQ